LINLKPVFHIGIDVGLNGAIAMMRPDGTLSIVDMPTGEVKVGNKVKRRIIPELLATSIKDLVGNGHVVAMVEKVSAMPGQGSVSMFQFGTSYGLVLGVLAALQIETHQVSPVTWKKHFRLTSSKDASRMKACSMFPAQAALFARVKDDGRAEAALLAVYGRDFT
jgi:crossover junction endodeoxyribonuclease RuvC